MHILKKKVDVICLFLIWFCFAFRQSHITFLPSTNKQIPQKGNVYIWANFPHTRGDRVLRVFLSVSKPLFDMFTI